MQSLHLARFYLGSLLLVTSFAGCGGGEKGGDHVPTDKTYTVENIPSGSSSRSIVPREYDTELLGRFVRIAENYRICLRHDQFSDEEAKSLQLFLSSKEGGANSYGLESLVNYSFATLQSFDHNKPRFSSRITLNVFWNDQGSCDLILVKAGTGDFPFSESDFSGKKRILFDEGQLISATGATNAIPIGFYTSGAASDDHVHLQKLIATFLGFAESVTTASFIHPNASGATATTWNVVDDKGEVLAGDDSLKIYGFAAAWYDLVKPEDLDRFHYYEDEFSPYTTGNIDTDDLLDLSPAGTPPSFKELPGNRYLYGARLMPAKLTYCYKDDSGFNITSEMLAAWTGFLSLEDSAGVHGKLHSLDATFSSTAELATTGCQLLVAFRNESQYPFSQKKANGLYAQEGKIKDANGSLSGIPVIYVDASNLSLSTDTTLIGSAKHVSIVLQHEYAHFLGFRHSEDQGSLQAPAGVGSVWTSSDQAFFTEYLKQVK